MRTLCEREDTRTRPASSPRALSCRWKVRRAIPLVLVCLAMFAETNCGKAGTPPGFTTPSPPSGATTVTVTVQPSSATIALGGTQQFEATVTGSSNAGVTWEVNGVAGGNSTSGTIASSGADAATYTAPGALPSPPTVTVTAVSQADTSASGSASVTLASGVSVTITVSPASASVPTAGAQLFTANITGAGASGTGVTWSVNGISGGDSTVGTIAAAGEQNGSPMALYAAPPVPPSPAIVTVTATSTADSSKFGSASVVIVCANTNSILPSAASVALGQTQSFTASFCMAAGTTIAWDVNGIARGNSTVGTIAANGADSATYTAPVDLPTANPVTVQAMATPPSGSAATASATITVVSDVTISVVPSAATLSPGQRESFAASVTNTTDARVSWQVNGVPNGNSTLGQICQSGTNPCVAPVGSSTGSVDYLAPSATPPINPVALTATSSADPSQSGSATILIANSSGSAAITVSPPYVFLAPSASMQFVAAVSGAENGGVTWSVSSAVTGQGCAGTACGSVTASGLYVAPSSAPSPNAISLLATSQADPTQSAAATIVLTNGPAIEVLLPSSVMAGAVEGFPLAVQGMNFIEGSGSTASSILVNGVPRTTTCSTANECVTAINPSDVQSAATLTVQVENPGNPAVFSNPVPFVIVPFDISVDTIALSSAAPVAASKNIVVVEPTTEAASSPISVDSIGLLTGGDNCGDQGSPLTITRPSSGTSTVSLCIFGDNLDPTFTYSFTGPAGAPNGSDIGVTASSITGLFPGTIELDLQISSATLPGLRTLFITTLNNDRAVVSGMLEVQ